MSSSSDITINAEAFNADRIDPSTAALNAYVVGNAGQGGVKWHDVRLSLQKHRDILLDYELMVFRSVQQSFGPFKMKVKHHGLPRQSLPMASTHLYLRARRAER
jgi:hypothetical protein